MHIKSSPNNNNNSRNQILPCPFPIPNIISSISPPPKPIWILKYQNLRPWMNSDTRKMGHATKTRVSIELKNWHTTFRQQNKIKILKEEYFACVCLQLKSFEELVVLGFGPALPRLGDGVGLAGLLGRVVHRIGEGSDARQTHSIWFQVHTLWRVRVFRHHFPFRGFVGGWVGGFKLFFCLSFSFLFRKQQRNMRLLQLNHKYVFIWDDLF